MNPELNMDHLRELIQKDNKRAEKKQVRDWQKKYLEAVKYNNDRLQHWQSELDALVNGFTSLDALLLWAGKELDDWGNMHEMLIRKAYELGKAGK